MKRFFLLLLFCTLLGCRAATSALFVDPITGAIIGPVSANTFATANGLGSGGGSGSVTSVNIATANGISATGGPITTSGSFTLILGAITPSSVTTGAISGTTLIASTGLTTNLLSSTTDTDLVLVGAGTGHVRVTSTTLPTFEVFDGTALTAGIGGQIALSGNVGAALKGTQATIKAFKTSSTDGSYDSNLLFGVSNSSGTLSTALSLAGSNLSATFSGGVQINSYFLGLTASVSSVAINMNNQSGSGRNWEIASMSDGTFHIGRPPENSNLNAVIINPSSGSITIVGQLISSLATGTAPFSVASTTQVANLYASRAALADTVTTDANLTGDVTSVGNATTLATVNSNVGVFGDATHSAAVTLNAKGLVTAGSNVTITPAITSVTGLGAGVATLLGGASSGTGGPVGTTSATIVTPTIASILGTATSIAGNVTISGTGLSSVAGSFSLASASPLLSVGDGSGLGAPEVKLNRGTTAVSNAVKWYTAGVQNWFAGSGATGTNTNWELYSYGAALTALSVSNSTGAVTIGATTQATIGGNGGLIALGGIYATKAIITGDSITVYRPTAISALVNLDRLDNTGAAAIILKTTGTQDWLVGTRGGDSNLQFFSSGAAASVATFDRATGDLSLIGNVSTSNVGIDNSITAIRTGGGATSIAIQAIATNASLTYTGSSYGLIKFGSTQVARIDTAGMSIVARVVTASDATSITPNSDNADMTYQLNTQSAGTLTINADAGTPSNGKKWILKLKCTNAQTFSWNSVFVSGATVTLPTASTATKIDNIGFIYDGVNSKWECVAVAAGY